MKVDVSNAAWAEETATGWQPAKRGNVVWFSEEPMRNEAKSLKEDRPIFDNVLFVHIRCPGDRLLEIDRKATNIDRQKYARELEAFRRKQDTTTMDGTPLDMWPQLDRRQVAELKALNIFTVENLATLPDSYGQKIMGFSKLKEKAATFMQAAKGQAEFDRMTAVVKERDAMIAAMSARITALEEKKKGGRPRKHPAAAPSAEVTT